MVRLEKNRVITSLEILSKTGSYERVEFLIDTGFDGTLLLMGTRGELEKSYDLEKIDHEETWAVLADGRKVKIFKSETAIRINGKTEIMQLLVLDSQQEKQAVLGIEFLKQAQSRLLLDFKQQCYQLT